MLCSRICNNFPVVDALIEGNVPEESPEEVVILSQVDASLVWADCHDILRVPVEGLCVPDKGADYDSHYLPLQAQRLDLALVILLSDLTFRLTLSVLHLELGVLPLASLSPLRLLLLLSHLPLFLFLLLGEEVVEEGQSLQVVYLACVFCRPVLLVPLPLLQNFHLLELHRLDFIALLLLHRFQSLLEPKHFVANVIADLD